MDVSDSELLVVVKMVLSRLNTYLQLTHPSIKPDQCHASEDVVLSRRGCFLLFPKSVAFHRHFTALSNPDRRGVFLELVDVCLVKKLTESIKSRVFGFFFSSSFLWRRR